MGSSQVSPRNRFHGQYLWSIPDKPVSVHFSLDAMDRMRGLVGASSPASRGFETGGLLLGHIRQANPDHYLVAIDDFEPVECEHVRGASWILSRRDRELLARRLRRLAAGREQIVVGWFRTHTRPGLFLDQHDFEIFQDYFAHPAMVALLIRPQPEAAANAGFFFWEEGDIQRTSSYRSFEFRPEAHAPQIAAVAAAALVTVGPSEIEIPAPTAPNPRLRPVPAVPRSRPATRWLLWVPVAVGLIAGVLWHPKPLERSRRMAAIQAPEEVRETRPAFPAPVEPTPIRPQQREEVAPIAAPETARPAASSQARVTRARVRTLQLPRSAKNAIPQPVLDVPSPPNIAAVRGESLPSLRLETQPHLASASVEPQKVSTLRRAVGSIPGLGFLKRKSRDRREEFVPARASRQVRPASPPTLTEAVPVRVKVTINEAGRVVEAELVSKRVDAELARLALDAAGRWQFEPAKLNHEPVNTEVVLTFRFGPNIGEI